jgi:hypothetical protein
MCEYDSRKRGEVKERLQLKFIMLYFADPLAKSVNGLNARS